MVNAGPVSKNNQLIYKTLLNNLSVLDHTNKSSLSSELFGQLLEQALLQAGLSGTNQDSSSSMFGSMSPINFTALGLTSALFGGGNSSLQGNSTSLVQGLSSLSNKDNFIDKIKNSINDFSSQVGSSLQYQEMDVNTLNSQLYGALQNAGNHFVEAGKKYQINPAFLAAISMHETGNGSSNAARFKNNVAGMMGKNGLKSYTTVEESIFDMARNLRKNYLDEGKVTISQIGGKYAPVGAANDPTGLNNHWVKGVQSNFDKMTKTDFS